MATLKLKINVNLLHLLCIVVSVALHAVCMANLSDLMGFELTVTIRYTVNFGQFLGCKSPLKSETKEPTKLLYSLGMRGCKFKSVNIELFSSRTCFV